MKEIKIQIPDNCELIKDGGTYIIKEKDNKPRSWEEFCENYPVTKEEYYFNDDGSIIQAEANFVTRINKTWCTSKEEADAFLALMQLRQLRKAWVGDWEQSKSSCAGIFYSVFEDKLTISYTDFWSNIVLSFPTREMADGFLNCFRDLCETAKILI